ncbi:MAG: oxidoreductase [Candidatus Saccharibacteria bacterium]|nr:oxidoreductase [Candidatus Saccharibacteria bacterium]
MYRLVVYGLGLLSLVGIFFASIGRFSITPSAMIVSLTLLIISCFLTEWMMAKSWRQPFNSESWLITALILFLIFPPPKTIIDAFLTVLIGVLAHVSKYLIAWNGKHIFNPAAFAVAVVGVLNLATTTWWVGSSTMWPYTLILGLLVVRKIKRFPLVITFVFISVVGQMLLFVMQGDFSFVALQSSVIASPLLFLSTIMLTEPATMPPRRNQQIIFGVIIAILYVGAWKVGPVIIYPEIALLLGNIYAFVVSPKLKVKLRLKEIQKISDQVWNFVFIPDRKFSYKAGQYMEWTMENVAFDGRGNRRSFTLASSPTEDSIQVGVKFYNPTSTYKYAMSRLEPGDSIYASQLSGNFTLDHNESKKLVFIAGGIGVTPFRSMVTYCKDMNIKGDIYLMYIVNKPEELAYANDFLAAKDSGVKLIPVLSDLNRTVPGMISSKLTSELIEKTIPDHTERYFYISGPNVMVESSKSILKNLGIKKNRIKTDYFSGY